MRVKEWKGDVIFLHEIVAGAADRSYGIQVARLAGLPPAVVDARPRGAPPARGDRPQVAGRHAHRRPAALLRRPPAGGGRDRPPDALGVLLDAIAPDELTPREALEALYRLKAERARRKD